MNDQTNAQAEESTLPAAGAGNPDAGASTVENQSQVVERQETNKDPSDRLIFGGAWLFALSLVLLALYLGWRVRTTSAAPLLPPQTTISQGNAQPENAAPAADTANLHLPEFSQDAVVVAVFRLTDIHTIIPTRPREEVITYTVGKGDSVFGIAKNFNIKPESVLWANYDLLKDSPDMLSPGMTLKIPPTDGVYYQWKAGDTLEGVAAQFKAKPEDIVNWSGNHLDLANPEIKAGQDVLVPGGQREFVQWVIPTIPRGQAGVNRSVYGPGACEGGYTGAFGTGTFIWPSSQHVLSGNDYWSGHLGIDIAAGLGDPMFASDAGVVVFAGWATGGYGNMVMIDHGNGYQSLYGHMSSVSARCGQSVGQGSYIGAAGSTGNSTGPHIHFEIRYLGGFINPWYMLP